MRKALEKSANEIVKTAKGLVPVGEVDGGTLRDSIGWTWGPPPEGSFVLGSTGDVGDGEEITIFAGNSEAFYARWVEFGTAHAAPQPFFFTSYRQHKKRHKSRLTRAVRKAVKEGAK